MKKIKVIFADGSIGEVDEKDLAAAKSAGAKLYTEDTKAKKTTTVKFKDGSEGEIPEDDLSAALNSGATVVKKKDSFQQFGEAGGQASTAGTPTTSPSNLPLKSTSESGLNKEALTSYLQNLKSPEEVKANSALPTKEVIADKLSTITPLLQVDKNGKKQKTFDQLGQEADQEYKQEIDNQIENVKVGIYKGTASLEDIKSISKYSQAQPFLESYLNAYADKDKLPAADVLVPGEHWDSAWKNSTFEQRPIAVKQAEDVATYYDGVIKGIEGTQIQYSQLSPFAKVIPENKNDQSFQETIGPIDVNDAAQLTGLKNKLSSQIINFKGVFGEEFLKKKREVLSAINFKLDQIERAKPIDKEIDDPNFSDKLYYALGDVEHSINELTSLDPTKREGITDDRKLSAFKRGLNYIKTVDHATYLNVKRGVEDKGQIAESDYQQILAKGQQLENENVFIESTKNKELVGAETNFDLQTKSSLVAKRSGALGETAKVYGLTNKQSFSEQEIDFLNKHTDWEAYNMKAPTDKELDFIKAQEGKWFYDQIPKTGFISAITRGVEQPFLSIARTIEDASSGSYAVDYLKSKELDRQTSGEQLTPDEKGNYGQRLPSDRGNLWYSVLEGAGSFIPQILLTKGLGAPFSAAAETAVTSAVPFAALTAENLFAINTATGTLLSSYLQSYGDGYEQALQKTGDPQKAQWLGSIGGVIDGIMEQWLPETKIGKNIVKNLTGDISEKLVAVIRKGGNPADLIKEGKSLLKPFVAEYLNVTGQEVAEEDVAVILKQIAETIISPSTAATNDVLSDLAQTTWSTALQTFVPAIGSGAASSKNRFTKEVFNSAAIKYDYSKDALDKSLIKGVMSQDEYNQSISLLKTHQNSIAAAPKLDATGRAISPENKVEYAYQQTQIKINENKSRNENISEVEKEILDKKINDSKAIQRSILMPSAPSEAAAATQVEQPAAVEQTANQLRTSIGDEKADRAVKDVKEFLASDLFPEATLEKDKVFAKENPLKFLKMISDQVFQPPFIVDGQSITAEDGLVKRYGTDVVELAKETFTPKGVTLQNINEKSPTVNFSVENNPPNSELTKNEQTDWNKLSMDEKRKLATDNLPEIKDNTEEKEIIKVANDNAKYLLAKMRGEEVARPENTTIQSQQNTGGQNAIQEQSATESVLRNEGVRGQGELQGVKQSNQPKETSQQNQEKVITPDQVVPEGNATPKGENIEDKKADIEKRRQKDLSEIVPIEIPEEHKDLPAAKEVIKKDAEFRKLLTEKTNEQYDAELAALEKSTPKSESENKRIAFEEVYNEGDAGNMIVIEGKVNDKKVGELRISKNKDKGYKIEGISVEPEEQGKGYGKEMYRFLNEKSIKDTGHPLSTKSESLNPNSKKIWEQFVKSGEAEKTKDGYSFKIKSEDISQPIEEKNPFLESKIQEPVYRANTEGKFRPNNSEGTYFTTNPDYAELYAWDAAKGERIEGIKVEPHFVDLKNPLRITTKGSMGEAIRENIEKAKNDGHDGIIVTDPNIPSANEVLVFNESQIKKINETPTTPEANKGNEPVVNTVESFSDRVATGEQMSTPEDLQYYENNREAIETELKRRYAENTVATEDKVEPTEAVKISDALFSFADKILKADITGSGGAALSNIFAIPQQILGRAIQAVALAVKAGETIASAVKKGIDYLKSEGFDVDEKEFTGFVNSIIAGEKPKVKTTGRVVDTDTGQDIQSEITGEYNYGEDKFIPGQDPISNHKLKTTDLDKAFGTDVTMQQLWNDIPSDDRFKKQVDMLDDGMEMIGMAQTMFGGSEVEKYGPPLLRFIKSMSATSDNKKAILLATFIGEIKNKMERTQSKDLQGLYGEATLYYRNFMHVTAKNLAAGRLLRLFSDKYMADIYQDVTLEKDQIKANNKIKEQIADTEIKEKESTEFQADKMKGKSQEEIDKEMAADKKKAEGDRKKSGERKKSKKDAYTDLYKKKEDEAS